MTPTLRRKLEALAERREELERLLADPSVIGDAERFRKFSREFSQLEPVATALADEARAKADLTAAEAIVDLQVARFVETMAASTRTAPLKRLRAHGEAARAEVLAKARQQLDAGQDPAEVLNFLAHTLTNRLLHAPTIALREAALSGNAELARAADKLFPEPPGEASDAASESDSGREA